MAGDLAGRLRATIRDIPDFPKPGIIFKDITPVLADPALFEDAVAAMAEAGAADGAGVTAVVGIESRGFIFGAPLALRLGVAFIPVRKHGKLPFRTVRIDYALEYGTDALEAHEDCLSAADRVLIVDDLLATGGTAEATAGLIRQLGAEVSGAAFMVELGFLGGRDRLDGIPVHSLVNFDDEG